MQKSLEVLYAYSSSQIICTSAFKFVPVQLQVIENRHWYFTWRN